METCNNSPDFNEIIAKLDEQGVKVIIDCLSDDYFYFDFDLPSHWAELKGISAIKKAMSIFYGLTQRLRVYGRMSDGRIADITYYMPLWYGYNHENPDYILLKNAFAMPKTQLDFLNCEMSQTFSENLWRAIKDTKPNSETTFRDIMQLAMEELYYAEINERTLFVSEEYFATCEEDGNYCDEHSPF